MLVVVDVDVESAADAVVEGGGKLGVRLAEFAGLWILDGFVVLLDLRQGFCIFVACEI